MPSEKIIELIETIINEIDENELDKLEFFKLKLFIDTMASMNIPIIEENMIIPIDENDIFVN